MERKRPVHKKGVVAAAQQLELVSKCRVGENGARRAVSTGIPVSQPLWLSLKWEEKEMIAGFTRGLKRGSVSRIMKYLCSNLRI
ncbi:hypothetical protein NPIL_487791 [Nephila pilipes]|uniref:Uncharacterized protein n=1 Tax=Nephila pilipes TaxID=299642 RepID=A0A8X6TFV7_NEPPI|nr:hypothetical protein NPIL_487791 [Nephila pilipes]